MRKISKKMLIIGSAVLLAMIIALVLILVFVKPAEDDPGTETPDTPTDTFYPLFEMEFEDFASVKIFNSYGETEIYADEPYLFNVRGVNAPMDSDTLTSLVVYSTDIQYTVLVAENPTDYEQYGLKEPEGKFTVTDINGVSKTFLVGNTNPSHDKCYIQEEGKPAVYLSDEVYDDFKLVRPAAMLSLELVPSVDTEDEEAIATVTKIRINSAKTAHRDVVLVYTNSESYTGTDASYYKYVMEEPMTGVAVNSDYVENYIFNSLLGITAMSGVDLNPSAEKMKEYGLDDPWGELELVIAGKTYSMLVSHEMYAGYCYVLMDGAVYFVPSTNTLSDGTSSKTFECLNVTVMALQTRFLFLDNISNFASFTVNYDGKKYKFVPYGTMFDDDDPWGIRMNGIEKDGDEFKKLYTLMLSLFIDGMTTEEESKPQDCLVSIVYEYADTKETVTMSYSSLDLRRCGVSFDGGDMVYYTMQKYVDKFITGLQNFLDGKPIDLYE